MLLIGNSVALILMFTVTPILVEHTGHLIDRQYKWVNDEGDKRLDEIRETFLYAIYFVPFVAINVVIIVIHFYFVNYERKIRQ